MDLAARPRDAGREGGVWRVEKTKKTVTLPMEPFEPFSRGDRSILEEEAAERLARFVGSGAGWFDLSFE